MSCSGSSKLQITCNLWTLSVNKAVKNFLSNNFRGGMYIDQICKQLAKNRDELVDLKVEKVYSQLLPPVIDTLVLWY